MLEKTYRNKAGKSFTEGKKFRMLDFVDYYNTLTDDEWDAAIEMVAKKGIDISNIKPYIRICCDDLFRPMGFEEVCDKLLMYHGFEGPFDRTCEGAVPIEDERHGVEELYARLGVPVPEYWRARLWS